MISRCRPSRLLLEECGLPVCLQHEIPAHRVLRPEADGAIEAAGLETACVRNLEHVVRGAEDRGDAAVLVEDVLQEREAVPLLGAVMQRIGTAIGGFDAQRIRGVVARDEVVEAAVRAAVIEARRDLAVAAAIDADLAAFVEQAGLGLHVDDAGGAVAIFGRQGAGDQLHRFRQPRIEGLSEHGYAFGNDDAVQAVLQAIVLAADMQLAEGILRGAWRLEDDLIEQRVLAARLGLDVLGRDGVGRGADLGLDAVAGFGEFLRGDDDGFDGLCRAAFDLGRSGCDKAERRRCCGRRQKNKRDID